MSDKCVAAARDAFRSLVNDNYELDAEFVDKLCEYWTQTTSPLLAITAVVAPVQVSSAPLKKGRGKTLVSSVDETVADKPKQRRKKSAYNVYVREMMKTNDIQQLDHKHKMGAIADQWRALNDEGKAEYVNMAANENDSLPA